MKKHCPDGLVTGLSLVSLSLFSTTPFAADHTDEPVDDAGSSLDPIVVTATLGPRTAGESLSSVTVLDEEVLNDQEPNEFSGLLSAQPGISVGSSGSFGKKTSVYTRGTSSQSTVFLVNGIRVRSATSGGAPWEFFPRDLAERVEIVRGPRSTLYGADAVGGVIQAFTPRAEEKPSGFVEATGGSFDTRKGVAGVNLSAGNTGLTLRGVHNTTNGTDLVEGGEDKGFRNNAGLARVVHTLPNGGEASLMMAQSEGNTEFIGGDTDFLLRTVGASIGAPLSNYWHTRISLNESRDEQETNNEFSPTSVFNTTTRTARWENTLTRGTHELVLGGELSVDEVSSTTDFNENSRTNAALFSQLRLNFGPSDLQLSLRGDDNEAYGREETGAIAFGHQFDQAHRMRISYGTSFRAPTFNDLFFPRQSFTFDGITSVFEGNPDLEPEEGSSVEVGASGRYDRWFWDVALYQLNVDNLIETQTQALSSTVFESRPANVSEAEIQGAEIAAGYEYHGWRTRLALTFTDPRDEDTDNRLRRRTAKSARLDLEKELGEWSLGGTFVAEGYRYEDAQNTRKISGYGTLDLRARWHFASDWTAKVNVSNVFDRRFSTALRFDGREYLDAGRTTMVSLRYDL